MEDSREFLQSLFGLYVDSGNTHFYSKNYTCTFDEVIEADDSSSIAERVHWLCQHNVGNEFDLLLDDAMNWGKEKVFLADTSTLKEEVCSSKWKISK